MVIAASIQMIQDVDVAASAGCTSSMDPVDTTISALPMLDALLSSNLPFPTLCLPLPSPFPLRAPCIIEALERNASCADHDACTATVVGAALGGGGIGSKGIDGVVDEAFVGVNNADMAEMGDGLGMIACGGSIANLPGGMPTDNKFEPVRDRLKLKGIA